jgi:PhnB protein
MVPGMTALAMHLVVADPDPAAAWYTEALGARETGRVVLPDTWGDRTGQFLDPSGHRWALDQHVREVSREEIARHAGQLLGGSAS